MIQPCARVRNSTLLLYSRVSKARNGFASEICNSLVILYFCSYAYRTMRILLFRRDIERSGDPETGNTHRTIALFAIQPCPRIDYRPTPSTGPAVVRRLRRAHDSPIRRRRAVPASATKEGAEIPTQVGEESKYRPIGGRMTSPPQRRRPDHAFMPGCLYMVGPPSVDSLPSFSGIFGCGRG